MGLKGENGGSLIPHTRSRAPTWSGCAEGGNAVSSIPQHLPCLPLHSPLLHLTALDSRCLGGWGKLRVGDWKEHHLQPYPRSAGPAGASHKPPLSHTRSCSLLGWNESIPHSAGLQAIHHWETALGQEGLAPHYLAGKDITNFGRPDNFKVLLGNAGNLTGSAHPHTQMYTLTTVVFCCRIVCMPDPPWAISSHIFWSQASPLSNVYVPI